MTSTTSDVSKKIIPLSDPVMGGNERKYIKECIDTGWVSSVGSFVDRFEAEVARYLGVSYAVAVVNGTAALHLALIVAGVQRDDEVLIPTLTFIAPVNTVRYVGAVPVFMDCDPSTLCIDVEKVQAFFTEQCVRRADGFTYNKGTGRKIAAVLPVHVFGHPADMDSLRAACGAMNVRLIEDATESLGSTYRGKKAGALGDIGCLSFNGNKIITTGGGGILVTNNEEWADRARHLSTQAKKDAFTYDHDEVGYNYRLTNIAAAMGVAQMEVLDSYVARKRAIAQKYRELLQDFPHVEFFKETQEVISNYWLSTIKAKDGSTGLLKYLNEHQIQARPVWKLIHTLPMYKDCQTYHIEHAVAEHIQCINLPSSVSIIEDDIERVVSTIKEYYG